MDAIRKNFLRFGSSLKVPGSVEHLHAGDGRPGRTLDDLRVAAANDLRLMFEVHCRDLFFPCSTTLNVIEEIQQYGDMVL